MPGLTAKVFRTFNASITLDDMLNKETKEGDVVEKILVYQHANKQVAIICNHQRSVSKSHSSQIEKLTNKIGELQVIVGEIKHSQAAHVTNLWRDFSSELIVGKIKCF
ncbi:hypothetical protein Ahy_B05g076242 [Arachis hypogaea]|uniref:DNA topoisomerase I eukaryotic-type domain-containing protein n=1 Tax=Arachis hypogaea TaxID=3818 RepID=A0A444Z2U9_ARAHY|nr:hypothetical protein Ahy_B05g076242 [Arachis hypogaea]